MNVKPPDASAWCTWLEQHGLSIAPKDLETTLAHDLARGELERAWASLLEGLVLGLPGWPESPWHGMLRWSMPRTTARGRIGCRGCRNLTGKS